MGGSNNWDQSGQAPADPAQPAQDPNAGQQGGWNNPTPTEPAQQPDPNAGGGWNPEPAAPANPEPAQQPDPNAGTQQPAGGQTWDQGQGNGDQGTNQGGTV